jgi:hypothetical protein
MIRRLRVPASGALDEKVHAAITQASAPPTAASVTVPDLSLWQILGMVMKKVLPEISGDFFQGIPMLEFVWRIEPHEAKGRERKQGRPAEQSP